VRNALILLAVVAGIILVAGAFNNGVVFDIDYVAGTASSVSLFWVSGIIAAIIFVAGLAASWFALSSAAGARRKLEAELQSTYERLRQTESQADEARLAAKTAEARVAEARAAVVAEATVVDEREAATVVVEPVATAALADEAATTVVSPDDAAETMVAAPDDAAETAVAADQPVGEQTAVTMASGTPPEAVADEAGADETAAEESPDAAPDDEKGPAAS
jgi:hypothetical protein